jgi:hypothetical protein
MSSKEDVYLNTILDNIPRILSNLNRNQSSINYGSFDRDFWHYKQNDISCARKQEFVKVLMLLYLNKFKNNIYYKDKKIKDYIFAALDFTCSIQNNDGSFNEWYINEGSFVATSFLTEALADTLIHLKKNRININNNYYSCLIKSCDWLIKNFELIVMNQAAGTILALHKVYMLTKTRKYKTYSEYYLNKFITCQDEEGWWSEYDGPDIGYLTVTFNYLSEYYELSKNKKLLNALKKSSKFIHSFIIDPKINIGGSYMSRNTNYIIPTGFIRLLKQDKYSEKILNYCHKNYLLRQSTLSISLDERYSLYFSHFILLSGLLIKNKLKKYKFKSLKIQNSHLYYKNSKINIIKKNNFSLIVNFNKGGCFHIYAKKNILDNGIFLKNKNNILTTNVISKNNRLKWNKNSIQVNGRMYKINEGYFNTFTLVLFKIFQKIFIFNNFMRKKNKAFLRNLVVRQNKKKTNIFYSRKLIFHRNNIVCEDIIHNPPSNSEIIYGNNGSSYSFVPSANFFNKNLLNSFYERSKSISIKSKQPKKILRIFKI